MKRSAFFLMVITLMSLFPGCRSSVVTQVKNEITISGMSSSIGGNPDNFSEQHYSFSMTLENIGGTEVIVRTVEPVLSEAFAAKAKGKDFKVVVDKILFPKTFIEVSGEIQFDATGMTKEQIVAMEPFFTGIKINTDKVLPLPGQSSHK